MDIFERLIKIISDQQKIIKSIADKLEQIESIGSGGGSGNASIADYESGVKYKRNTLLVDTYTETVYRVIPESYVSVTVEDDKANGNLKLVGFESQIVTFDHNPSQSEINTLPDDSLVAVYSRSDTPYLPDNTN